MSLSHIEYHNRISEELSRKLEELYQSIYCTQAYLEIFKDLNSCRSFCLYENGALVQILIYKKENFGVTILNELFSIEDRHLNYFSNYIFKIYTNCHFIHFNRLTSEPKSDFHQKIWDIKNNIAIDLPRSFEEYREKLTKKTRTNYQYSMNKLSRDHGDFILRLEFSKDIDKSKVDSIFEFNKKRMNVKRISTCFDEEFKRKVYQICEKHGIVGTLNIREMPIAGSICFQTGSHAYGYIISHNPLFNKYSPGFICNVQIIKALIEMGIKKFHMEYGESTYKYKLLGERNNIYYITICRNVFFNIIGYFFFFKKSRNYKKFIGFIKYKVFCKFFTDSN